LWLVISTKTSYDVESVVLGLVLLLVLVVLVLLLVLVAVVAIIGIAFFPIGE